MENKINFTKAIIDSLSIPESGKRNTYHDIKTSGLQLRITSTGVKTFSVYRRIKGGEPERITLGRYPDMTIEQARREAVRIAVDFLDGRNPAEVKRGKKAELTFSELFGDYMERHSKPKKKTWFEDQAQFRLYLEKPLGKKKLSTIDRKSIAQIHSSITKAGYAPTANRVKALLSSVFGWAIAAGLCESNPAIGVKSNKENQRDRFLQSDELPRFFEAVAKEENETIRDYVLMSLLTGARRSNVLAMRWQDINFERAEWRIEETKNGTPQTVALSPEAIEILHHRKPPDNAIFVFPGSGKSGHLQEPKKGWKRILERAGISDLRIHDLRRTLGSWQAKTGASLAIIGKSLNHKNQNTTAIYARLDLDPVRDSVNKATKAMLTAGRGGALNSAEKDALLATELFVKNGGAIDDPKAPWLQWFALYQIDHLKSRYELGDKSCLMQAIRLCANHGLIIPEWAVLAIEGAHKELFATYEKKSWDDVFGKPHKKWHYANAKKRRRSMTVKIWQEVNAILEARPKTPIAKQLFDDVGKRNGLCSTLAEQYYYSVKRNFQNNKANQALIVKSRAGASFFLRPKKRIP